MSAFLFLLVKLNLAMGMAVILVALLRRPLRLSFGAPIAYAIWLLVPVAGIATLFPPRVAAPAPVAAVHVPAAAVSLIGPIAHSTLRLTEQVTGQMAGKSALVLAIPPASAHAMPDTALLFFAAWALGVLLTSLYLARLQRRFSAAVRLGKAGPAVLGFLRPRIVTPDGFEDHFTLQEQAAILAHERVHLARQDARINALTALLRCLCWFNPLIHLGARWLRIDQELACDATVVSGAISRRDYAKALLKSQMMVMTLPLGCNWPGSQHPLIERIALLKHRPPGTVRRLAGVSLVMLAASFAGLGAWAAQPPVAAKPVAAPRPVMVLTMRAAPAPAQIPAPAQTAAGPAADANPSGSGDDEVSKSVRGDRPISVAPARPRTVRIEAGIQTALAALPQMASISGPRNIADPSANPIDQAASSTPRDTLAKNSVAGPGIGDAAGGGASPADVSGPGTGTEPALGCMLGFGQWRCQSGLRTPNSRCGVAYEDRYRGDCPEGPLEEVDYLGANTAGADVYQVQYLHTNVTYVIAPPGPDGNIRQFWTRSGNPAGAISPLVRLTSPSDPRLIWRRSSVAASEPIVMPATPSGAGDPNIIVCRAPQRIAGTNQFGEEACGRNSDWQKLALNGKDVAPDGKTLIARAAVAIPTGEGDPDAVTCRAPLFSSSDPPQCRTNRFWADLIKNQQMLDVHGGVITVGRNSEGASATGTAAGPGAPHPMTEQALACLLGMAPKGCANIFAAGAHGAGAFAWQFGPDPYFRSAQYVGRDDRGEYVKDVWDVKYRNQELIYLIRQPDQDGKIRGLGILPGPLACENWQQPSEACNPRTAPTAG